MTFLPVPHPFEGVLVSAHRGSVLNKGLLLYLLYKMKVCRVLGGLFLFFFFFLHSVTMNGKKVSSVYTAVLKISEILIHITNVIDIISSLYRTESSKNPAFFSDLTDDKTRLLNTSPSALV